MHAHTLWGVGGGFLVRSAFTWNVVLQTCRKRKSLHTVVFAPIPPVSPITSITNRPLCIYVIYFSTLITSSRRRVTEGDSFKKSVAVASTFQITDCICPADLISLQSPCRADQKPFKDLFMKRYLTYSISPAVALACQLHWMMADQTTAVEAIKKKMSIATYACIYILRGQLAWKSCLMLHPAFDIST